MQERDMHEQTPYSIYNTLIGSPRRADHPLRDLLPEDRDHGWHVARHLLKPLNHLEFLRRQEAIAVELHLHSLHTPRELFERNYTLLAEHQAGMVPTATVVTHLSRQRQRERLTYS